MTKNLSQFEKNVGISFSYVKKDILSVNDSVSDLHDQMQHVSLNQAMLLEKIAKLEQKLTNKNTPKKATKKKTAKKNTSQKTKKTTAKPVKKIVKETTVYQ